MSEPKVKRFSVTRDGDLITPPYDNDPEIVVLASDFKRIEAELADTKGQLVVERNSFAARIAALSALLQEIRPHTDALICYASTVSEHPLNDLGKRIDGALAAFAGAGRQMTADELRTQLDRLCLASDKARLAMEVKELAQRIAALEGKLAQATALLQDWHDEYHPQPPVPNCCATQQFLAALAAKEGQ